jgi:Rieske Fe-S protein
MADTSKLSTIDLDGSPPARISQAEADDALQQIVSFNSRNRGNPNIRAMNRQLHTDEYGKYQLSKETSANRRFVCLNIRCNHQR